MLVLLFCRWRRLSHTELESYSSSQTCLTENLCCSITFLISSITPPRRFNIASIFSPKNLL